MNWINYLLQTNLYLLCFYALYKLAFSRETYFNLNRAYLVGFTTTAFFIPFWQSGVMQSWFITKQISQAIYTSGLNEVIIYTSPAAKSQPFFDMVDWLILFYALGILYMSVLFCINLFKAQRFVNSKNAQGLASSFFGKIRIDQRLPHQDVIYSHELAHGRQVHSFDLMLISVVKIICWFNPIVYLLHIEFKKIHEFIADSEAATLLGSKKVYAEILVSNQFGTNANVLIHNFYDNATLKTRLKMLSKNKSPKVAITKYGLIAPAFVGVLILASSFVSKPEQPIFENVDLKNWNFFSSPFVRELAKVKGYVKTINGDPLSRAVVRIKGNSSRACITDAKGFFKFEGIESDAILIVSHVDYKTFQTSVSPQMIINLYPEIRNEKGISVISYDGSEVNLTKAHFENKESIDFEKPPMFPGGLQEMNSYIGKSINYPLKAKNERIEGLVNVKFTIDQNGNAINPVIVTGIGGGCDEEVIRIINMMPKWSPASLNGKVVSVEYTIPVKFQLQEEQNTKTKNEVIFTAVAEQPKFPGGTDAMYNYIGKNLIYPTEAIESSVEGRVFANFIVDKEGKIRDVNILKGIGHGCDEAAKQVLIHMPTWIAGRQNGKPVNVYVTMPIVFKLTNEKRNNSSQKVRSILEKEKNLDEYSDNQ